MSFSFGTTQKPASNTFSFGNTAGFGQNTTPSTFGNTTAPSFGSTNTTAQLGSTNVASQPSQQSNQLLISKYTKFNDLPQDVQERLTQLHKKIQDGKIQSQKISTKYTASQLKHLKNKHINDKLLQKATTIGSKIKSDLDYVRGKLRTQLNDQSNQAEVSIRIYEAMMRNGGVGSISVTENALGIGEGDPIWMFFTEFSHNAHQNVVQYRRMLDEVEQQVEHMVKAHQVDKGSQQSQLIPQVLKVNFDALVQLSAKVAILHQQLHSLTNLYDQWRKVSFLDNHNDPVKKLKIAQKENKLLQEQDLFRKSTYQEMSRRIEDAQQTVSSSQQQPQTTSQFGNFGAEVSSNAPSFSFGKK